MVVCRRIDSRPILNKPRFWVVGLGRDNFERMDIEALVQNKPVGFLGVVWPGGRSVSGGGSISESDSRVGELVLRFGVCFGMGDCRVDSQKLQKNQVV